MTRKKPEWRVAGVSRTGFSHIEGDVPCQDSCEVLVAGQWFIAAVSDGAGSAAHADIGSAGIARNIVAQLALRVARAARDGDRAPDPGTVREWIEQAVELTRERIVDSVPDSQLHDYHATLVGCVAGAAGGVLFHIGDGAACAYGDDDYSSAVMSLPENGEYANETYFFTEDDWQAHLRLTPFDGGRSTVLLMSDGVTPFALAPGGALPFADFIKPVTDFLSANSQEVGEAALANLLDSERIRPISKDDKTFLWAQRG